MPLTVHQIVVHRLGLPPDYSGPINGKQYQDVNFLILGGCGVCEASIAGYNACPSKSGYWKCLNGCIGNDGFETFEEYDAWEKEWEADDDEPGLPHDRYPEDDWREDR